MADGKYDIEIALKAQIEAGENVKNAVDEINQKVEKLSESTSSLNNVWTGAMMNIGAKISDLALKLPGLATEAIKAFGQQELAIQQLSAAIRAHGGNVAEVLPIMRQFASDMQAITTYGDEQVHSMMSMATSMGVTSAQMDEVIRSAIGLSTALGMDVTTATKAAASAVQGKTGMLQEFIPALAKCKTEEEKLAQVQRLSASGFAQAEAAANTLDGKLKQAANAWGDLQEVIGEAFAPTVKAVAVSIRDVCKYFAEIPVFTKAATISLTSLAVGFAFTKVGGLVNVSKMIMGVTTATKAATAATHAFNLAIKANPIGLIASVATAAILGLTQLAEYIHGVESAEEKELAALEAAAEARRKAADDARAATAILDEYAQSVERDGQSADDTAVAIDSLADEIVSLSDRSKWKEGEHEATAQKLVDKKKELVALQEEYLRKVNQTADAEYQYASNRELERKYRVEQELNDARKTGISHVIKFKEQELKHVEELQKSVELQKKYYSDHKHLVASEEDRKRIMAEAAEYAKGQIELQRQETAAAQEKADTQTWLNSQIESSQNAQRALELEILKAKASGNAAEALELEQKLKISQLASQIFDSSRKETMSKDELISLQNTAQAQAQERYNMEKAVTDEVQRQNLAKNAQAKIEDILLTNKIEQLKSEGKLTAAKELEREREIKRTLAGIEGLSDEDKASLANTMRQTNDYRDKQESARSQGGGFSGGSTSSFGGTFSRGTSSFGSSSRKNSLGGGISSSSRGGTFGTSARYSGPTPSRRSAPATVSAKNMELYEEWRASGGSKSGESWTSYRTRRRKELDAQEAAGKADKNMPKQQVRVKAAAAIDNISGQAAEMASRVQVPKPGGDLADSPSEQKSQKRSAPKDSKSDEAPKENKSSMNSKLKSKGVSQKTQTSSPKAGGSDSVADTLRRIEMQVATLISTRIPN